MHINVQCILKHFLVLVMSMLVFRTVLGMCSGEAAREADLNMEMSAHRLKGESDAGMLLCRI